jgi:signal transduction histidine kinase
MRRWFLSRSIRWQITALAIGPVVLAVLLALLSRPLTTPIYDRPSEVERTQIRIDAIVAMVGTTDSRKEVGVILEAAKTAGIAVGIVSTDERRRTSAARAGSAKEQETVFNGSPPSRDASLRRLAVDDDISKLLVVPAKNGLVLAFARPLERQNAFISDEHLYVLAKITIGTILVLFSSIYAGAMISAPLTRFADAAYSLDPDAASERPFPENGSVEMRKLAAALNDMRGRILGMLEDRTRMVRAISHDLRTPLTRLRLKAERSMQPELSFSMLRDITYLDEMIGETLAFLSEDVLNEETANSDIPSMLQTVCADFVDVGYDVRYLGPDRFAYPCKQQALTRAVSNLVDNGTKFASVVLVRLAVEEAGSVTITVEDDGPGVAEELREKVLEPFYKADAARSTNGQGGFGLGLSIVNDVVHSHGGTVHLSQSSPNGLAVRIDLPAVSCDFPVLRLGDSVTNIREAVTPRVFRPTA